MAEIKLFQYYRMFPEMPSSMFPGASPVATNSCARFCRLTKGENGAKLIEYNHDIDDSEVDGFTARVYNVPDREFETIVSYIREEHIFERMKEARNTPGTMEHLMMTGGMVGVFSHIYLVLEDGSEAYVRYPVGDEIDMLLALHEKCGQPVDEMRGIYATHFGVHIPMEYRDDVKPAPNSWECKVCGAKGNIGKFCAECGKPKQNYK